MSDSDNSVGGGESTPPSSVPSPELFKLTLAEVTEERKATAVSIKAEANKAFMSTLHPVPSRKIFASVIYTPECRYR